MSKPTCAILGASSDRSKYGNKSLRAHLKAGYEVFPVNPRAAEVEGLTAYASVQDIPVERLDRVSVYLPPAISETALDEVAAKGCDELWFNPGSDSPQVIEKAQALGLNAIRGCSIVDLGMTPGEFPG